MNRILFVIIFLGIYFLLDFYVFQIIKTIVSDSSLWVKKLSYSVFWVLSVAAIGGVLLYNQLDPMLFNGLRIFLSSFFFITLVSKLFSALFLLGDDIRRFVTYLAGHFIPDAKAVDPGRSDFITKAAVVGGTLPLVTFSFGIISGAHDYRVRKRTIFSKSLPKSFDGFRIVQISDIHTGSFFNKRAVEGGVEMINAQKADLVVFTGDLVNNQSDEAKPYLDVFSKIKAPFGVKSIMGNHDYGDYRAWNSPHDKERDIKDLHEMHHYMKWNLLLNENRTIESNGEKLGLIGVENWGNGRFSKYGDLTKAYGEMKDTEFKILLSHDPSHWDAQIRAMYPDIQLTLSGHTHGMQFGIEIGDFRWSPSQYIYKQWADLYQEGDQFLYVNRGFGFIGYPGRVGILPEITVLELKKG